MPTSSESSSSLPRRSLTIAGSLTLVVAIAMIGIGGVLFGLAEFTGVGIALAVLVGIAVVTVRLRRLELSVRRVPAQARYFSGQPIEIHLEVLSTGIGRTPPMRLHDATGLPDGHKTWTNLEIPPLAPGETHTARCSITTTRRGIVTLGPTTFETNDPFGLTRRYTTDPSRTRITVLPHIDRIRPPTLDVDAESRPIHAATATTGSELASLRDYVPGDDIRKVHWRTSARRQDLVVRQDHQPRRPGCMVVLECRSQLCDDATFERLVCAAASILVSAAGDGQRVRLATTDGFDSAHGSGRDHLGLVLAELAVVKTTTEPLNLSGFGRDPIVIVSTPAGAPSLRRHLNGTGRRLTVLVGADDRTTVRDRASDSIVVGPTDRFDTVWDASMHARGLGQRRRRLDRANLR